MTKAEIMQDVFWTLRERCTKENYKGPVIADRSFDGSEGPVSSIASPGAHTPHTLMKHYFDPKTKLHIYIPETERPYTAGMANRIDKFMTYISITPLFLEREDLLYRPYHEDRYTHVRGLLKVDGDEKTLQSLNIVCFDRHGTQGNSMSLMDPEQKDNSIISYDWQAARILGRFKKIYARTSKLPKESQISHEEER